MRKNKILLVSLSLLLLSSCGLTPDEQSKKDAMGFIYSKINSIDYNLVKSYETTKLASTNNTMVSKEKILKEFNLANNQCKTKKETVKLNTLTYPNITSQYSTTTSEMDFVPDENNTILNYVKLNLSKFDFSYGVINTLKEDSGKYDLTFVDGFEVDLGDNYKVAIKELTFEITEDKFTRLNYSFSKNNLDYEFTLNFNY